MKLYEPQAGSSIDLSCKEAVALAMNNGRNVTFTFNGIALVATPHGSPKEVEATYWSESERQAEAYRSSPKGIAEAKRREEEIAKNQATVTAAFKSLPGILALKEKDILAGKSKLDLVMGWLYSFAHHSDDIALDWDKAAGVKGGKEWLRVLLMSAGYRENEFVGNPPEFFTTKEHMGRYIVGQVINCLSGGMGPHPITITFIEKYNKLKA